MTIPFHPLANLFPLIDGAAAVELTADIRQNGVREPLVVHESMFLDGRNRYLRAIDAEIIADSMTLGDLQKAGIPIRFFDPETEGDPLAFVLSLNLHRRHLSESQREMIAAEIATMRQGRPSEWDKDREDKPANRPDLSQADAAELLSVSERNVRRARAVLDHGTPELVEAVKSDRLAVSAAAEVAKLSPADQLDVLRSVPSHLVARVAKERVGNGARSVNAGRIEPSDSLDFFPTPPWATRALIETVLGDRSEEFAALTVWEPACGEGHISGVLEEYFGTVIATDIFDYSQDGRSPPSWRGKLDFLGTDSTVDDMAESEEPDWIISNWPFSGEIDRALACTLRALPLARKGVAAFVRTQWLEGSARYRELFRPNPPTLVAQFVERVPLHKGRWEPDGDTLAQYCWLIWLKDELGPTGMFWIPPGQRSLCADERDVARFTARPVMPTPADLRVSNSDAPQGAAAEGEGDGVTAVVLPQDSQTNATTGNAATVEPSDDSETTAGRESQVDRAGAVGTPDLPHADIAVEHLTKDQQNDIIRAGYLRVPKVTAVELMLHTGLKRSTIEMRAKAMDLADPVNRLNAVNELNRRRAATNQEPTRAA
jgi:hypothetical protein